MENKSSKEEQEPRFNELALVQELPLVLQEIPPGFPDKQKDRLLGVLLETDANRLFLLGKIAEVIKRGEHVAVIHVDVDWLKFWNDSWGREFGDKVILHSACAVAEIITNWSKDVETEIIVFRADHAADETWFFVLGLSEEKAKLVDELGQKITSSPLASLPNKQGREISFSAGVSCSADEVFRNFTKETQKLLENGQIAKPYDLLNNLREKATSAMGGVKIRKLAKIVEAINKEPTVDDFIEAAVSGLGELRLDASVLRLLLGEVRRRTLKE